jgi:crossover junction endodeoxyribonuclease RusA
MSTFRLDWTTPPLTENQRWSHWANKGRVVKDVRLTGRLLTARFPGTGPVEVTLTWIVNTRHRRDADNIVPTLKALCDGLVDAGVVPDDTPEWMVKHMPVIRYDKSVPPHMELRVTRMSEAPGKISPDQTERKAEQ